MARNPTGNAVLHASLELFRQDPQMLWLPVLAAGSAFLAFTVCFTPLVLGLGTGHLAIVLGIAVGSFAATLATIGFNVALVYAASDRMEGRVPTVGGCLERAWARRVTIAKWAVLSALVGTALRGVNQRLGVLGRLVGLTGAFAWVVSSFLVVPVLAFEDLGPLDALRRASQLLKSQFGTVARSGFRFGAMFLAWTLAALAVLALGVALLPASLVLGAPLTAIGVFCVFCVSMYAAAAGIYMRTLLYRYATGQRVPEIGVDLAHVFR